MIKYIKYLPFFLLAFLFLNGCSSQLESKVIFKNIAAGSLRINFRGEEVIVPAGKTVTVGAIQNGLYSYSTTYEIPVGAASSSASGAVSGDITINAGTKILIIYSSTYLNGVYELFATMSSSDDLSTSSTTSP
jgi:hypothetical protein